MGIPGVYATEDPGDVDNAVKNWLAQHPGVSRGKPAGRAPGADLKPVAGC